MRSIFAPCISSSTWHTLQLHVDVYASPFFPQTTNQWNRYPESAMKLKTYCRNGLQLNYGHFCIHWSEVCMLSLLYLECV